MTTSRTRTETVRERIARLLCLQIADSRAYILGGLRAHAEPTEADAAEVDAVLAEAGWLAASLARTGTPDQGQAERHTGAYIGLLWKGLIGTPPDSDLAADVDDAVSDVFDRLAAAHSRRRLDG